MRKKYLSALLFGALLFASAGTFTSCKDYDDDIDNLSQRIDQVASDLNDLKTKVDALGGYVENVSFADGVLSVTTGGNTVTYNIPDKTGVNEVTLALDGNNLVLTVDGEAQTIALPAGETGEVEIPEIEVKDGVLYINGEPQTLKVDVESNVTVIESTIPGNETYTVMVNGEEVTFAKAFADVRISLVTENDGDDFYFTDAKFANKNATAVSQNGTPSGKQENGIHWTILSQDVKWDGPKGDLKAGLVVGQVTAAEVSVRPINYDLTTAELTLVSSKGEVAPVTVIATKGQKEGPLSNGTRSADVNYSGVDQGDYVLSLVFDKFTAGKEAEEIISKFANATQTGNIKYALAVDGVVATDYNFIIDTQLKADAQPSCETPNINKFVIGGKGEVETINGKKVVVVKGIPTDGKAHRMTYLDGRIYDMKVAINASDVADAEVYGLTVDTKAGTIAAGANAVNRTFKLDVTLIDVNGNVSKTETLNVKFGETIAQEVTLSPMTYNVTPAKDKSLLVDVGNTFSSLSASDAISINTLNNIEWKVENNDKTFLWTVNGFESLNGYTGSIKYYDKDMNDIDMSDDVIDEAVRSIKYVKFIIDNDNYPNTEAKQGEHLISVTINRDLSASDNDDATKLIKKVNIPVHVVLPAWEDVFVKTGEWDGDDFVTRIVATNAQDYAEISMNAFDEVKGSAWQGAADDIYLTKLVYTADGNNDIDVAKAGETLEQITTQAVNLDYDILTEDIATTHKLAYETMHTVAAYKIGNVKDFVIKTEEFDVQLKSLFADAALKYYSGDKASDTAILNAADYTIATATVSNNKAKDGLALELKGNRVGVNTINLADGSFKAPYLSQGFWELQTTFGGSYNGVKYEASADASGLVGAGANVTATGVQITKTSGQVNNGGTFTLTFTDVMGVQTTASIDFELSK